MNVVEYEFIAELYPKGQLTVLHGTYGSGKSYSVIKSLNKAGITPIYVNLDNTAGLSELNFYNVHAKFLYEIGDVTDVTKDSVLIIDTYTRVSELFDSKYTDIDIANALEELTDYCTVIVIGHTADFVGKDGIFRDNPVLVRNSAETLWLSKTELKRTSTLPDRVEYSLHVNKGRGNGGPKVITNWMR